jgi:hypothetical protein
LIGAIERKANKNKNILSGKKSSNKKVNIKDLMDQILL